ncbi:unnamed protein product [Withania somnifera]
MSRCYPYPPPGYSPNTATNYALIQSIKRDKKRVKLERKKEKKREKKERKRKKKELSFSRNGNLISGRDNRELKTSNLQKDIEDNIVERLENISLSDEHSQAVCSQDPSYSSDSTQNNNKRKRSTSPSNGIHGHGTVVRIQLSSHKHGQCDISNKEDYFKESEKCEAESASSPLPKTNKQLFPFMLVSGQPIAKDKTISASCSKLYENDIEQEFKNLIISCAPPSFHHEFDDQDWLFQRKEKCMRMKEKGEVSNMSCGTSALLPHAQYLDDAELYAFPFTVPF